MQKKIFSLFLAFVCITVVLCACQAPTQQSSESTQNLIEESNPTTTAPSENDTENDDETAFLDWKTAYSNFIDAREKAYGKESDYGFDFRYALVYIDNDDVPELYAMGAIEADGDLICAYKNGSLIEQHLRRNSGGKYVEKSGIMINQNGHMGRYYDVVYRLDETGFSQILEASYTERYEPLENGDYAIINEYFIDGKPVSKNEYDDAIHHAVDLSKTTKFYENAVPADVIKEQIAEIPN